MAKVSWVIDDNGRTRKPFHCTEVPDVVLNACDTAEDREAVIDGYVTEDFKKRITFFITNVD